MPSFCYASEQKLTPQPDILETETEVLLKGRHLLQIGDGFDHCTLSDLSQGTAVNLGWHPIRASLAHLNQFDGQLFSVYIISKSKQAHFLLPPPQKFWKYGMFQLLQLLKFIHLEKTDAEKSVHYAKLVISRLLFYHSLPFDINPNLFFWERGKAFMGSIQEPPSWTLNNSFQKVLSRHSWQEQRFISVTGIFRTHWALTYKGRYQSKTNWLLRELTGDY